MALAEALGESQSMTTLDISHNPLTAGSIGALADALEQSSTMTTLNMSFNNLTDVSAMVLAASLKKSNSMTNLDFHRNDDITVTGAEALAEWARECRGASTLVLDREYTGIAEQAMSDNRAIRGILVLASAGRRGVAGTSPIHTLARADGDHAVAHRVMEFLNRGRG